MNWEHVLTGGEQDRRQFLGGMCGLLSMASLLSPTFAVAEDLRRPKQRIKRVIFLFMNGGPSQIDTFDPKPNLSHYDGTDYAGPIKISSGTRVSGKLCKSEFQFHKCGESGIEISELFPELSRNADDLCVIRSMQTTSSLHAGALLEMNTGRFQQGGASLGAWIDYGLGHSPDSLPSFVVMLDPRGGPINGQGNWSTGALPVTPATRIHSTSSPFPSPSRKQESSENEKQMRQLLNELNQEFESTAGSRLAFEQRNLSYHVSWKMRDVAAETGDLSQETDATRQAYGLDNPVTSEFGSRCLLARRMIERGSRFIQIYSGGGAQKDTWDAHTGNGERHRKFAGETDRPIAALLNDLKQRGLWEETVVVWGGEFGRTPTIEYQSNGRDHNPYGFSMWLAGGPVRGGTVIGATDELGLKAVETPLQVADLHATLLHLLGIDYTKLVHNQNGISINLTGTTPCRVITEVLL
ncbi:DUF1501 domain-containing protein [Planctomicrobium sp. SH527]|uniref:DUF1501 domain-containing protein n=1 Tax=Planctomicrobium sp. SH527 TaxID=3448123 RepID=UPI003F5C3DA9